MVLADSHDIPRVPCYSGTNTHRPAQFQLRDSHPLRSGFPTCSPTTLHPCPDHAESRRSAPQHHACNTSTFTHTRFRLFRVRSPLLTESLLFSLPMGTEMFHFPTSPPPGLYIHPVVTTHNTQRGSPIRTPSDHSSFTNSPRLIADYRVLHRLLMPRHPPCALEHSPPHTPHTNTCMQYEAARRITQETQEQTKSQQPHTQTCARLPDARVHYSTNKQPTHTTPQPPTTDDCSIGGVEGSHPHRACSPTTQQRACPTHHTPPIPSIHEETTSMQHTERFVMFHP